LKNCFNGKKKKGGEAILGNEILPSLLQWKIFLLHNVPFKFAFFDWQNFFGQKNAIQK
jgi:hypothetical protein